MGLAELLGRGQRPGQAGRGVRLPLDARSRISATARRWPAPASTRRSPRARSPCRRACAARSARCAGSRRTTSHAPRRSPATSGSAASALLAARRCCAPRSRSTRATVLAAERAIVRDRFGGSGARYRAALAAAHVTLADARAIIADRLAPRAGRGAVPAAPRRRGAELRRSSPRTRRRTCGSSRSSPRRRGSATRCAASPCETIAPEQVFSLRGHGDPEPIDTIDGRFAVRPLGPSLPLYALPPATCAATSRAACSAASRRTDVYDRLAAHAGGRSAREAVCARDDLPATGDVDLTAWPPFLGT